MLTLAGTSIGLLIWLILWLVSRRRSFSSRALTGLLLSVGLACRLAFLIGTPTFYAPDEQSHYNYVRYLAERRAFPVQTSRTDDPSNDWEYYQPPLYYLSLVPLYWAADALWDDIDLTVRLLRGASILFWGITCWLSHRILDRIRPGDEAVRSFALGLVCLLPTYAFISSSLNNDNLLIALGSAVLLRSLDLARPDLPGSDRLKRSLLLGFVLGLALLTKLTAVIYLVWLGGLYCASVRSDLVRHLDREQANIRSPFRLPLLLRTSASLAPTFLLPIALAALIWSPWGWRNLVVYGSLTAETIANVPREWPSLGYALSSSLYYMHNSFWSVSGIYNNIFGLYRRVGQGISLAIAGGWLVGLAIGWKDTLLLAGKRVAITVVMILSILVNALLVLRFGVLYGQAQGRFLFPLLLPIALLLGTGLRAGQMLSARRARLHLAGIQIAYLVSFTAYSLAAFPG